MSEEKDYSGSDDVYVEIATRLIYEVKFFPDFVLVRPASPAFYTDIRKLTHVDFSKLFEEFYGNRDEVFNFLYKGGKIDLETKH